MSQVFVSGDSSAADAPASPAGALEGQWVSAQPSYVWVWLVSLIPFFGILAGAFAALTFLFWMLHATWLMTVAGALTALVLVWGLWWMVTTPRRTRALRYQLCPNHMMVSKGLLFRKVTSVPYGRIQYVDVESGPLERMNGLTRLSIRTAGVSASRVVLYGIPQETGQQLRQILMHRADERMAAL